MIHFMEWAIFTVSVMCFHHLIMALEILPTVIILYGRIKGCKTIWSTLWLSLFAWGRTDFWLSGALRTCLMKNKWCQMIVTNPTYCTLRFKSHPCTLNITRQGVFPHKWSPWALLTTIQSNHYVSTLEMRNRRSKFHINKFANSG